MRSKKSGPEIAPENGPEIAPENGPENGPETPPTWQAQLRDDNIRFVRVVWCDNGNQIRGKALHIDALTRQLEGGRAWGRWARCG